MENRLVNLKFPRGYVELYLTDGRLLRAPVRLFPGIKQLTDQQRQQWQILDGVGFTFQDTDEAFHLQQFGILAPID
jgi:hypothetical protein